MRLKMHSFLIFLIIKKVKIFISGEYFNRRDIFSAFGEICQEGDPDFQHVFDFFQEVNYGSQSYSQCKYGNVRWFGPIDWKRHQVQRFLVIACDFIPPEAKTFLKCTRDQVEHPKVIVTATSFTFGREDLLPHIFKQLIQQPLLKEIFQNYHLRANPCYKLQKR